VSSKEQLVDKLTKPLVSNRFPQHTFNLNVYSSTLLLLRWRIGDNVRAEADPHPEAKFKAVKAHEISKDKINGFKWKMMMFAFEILCYSNAVHIDNIIYLIAPYIFSSLSKPDCSLKDHVRRSNSSLY
jgi:hypothetical protein